MSRIPAGCVSMASVARNAGISLRTAFVYAKKLGLHGFIPAERAEELASEMKGIRDASIESKRERCRKGNYEAKRGIISFGELASLAGCSWSTARRILRNLGWPPRIPRGRASEAVAVIKETMAENARLHAAAAAKARWISSQKAGKIAETVCKTVKPAGKSIKKAEVPFKTDGGNADWSWRVAIRGDCGWIVVRTGTKDEMIAWAALLVDNGIMAEARKNKYGGMA